MGAGNWDDSQHLSKTTGQIEWPSGPLTLETDEAIDLVHAWVVQGSTGAFQVSVQKGPYQDDRWLAGEDYAVNGKFKEGPALGIGLAAGHYISSGKNWYYFWLDPVWLKF